MAEEDAVSVSFDEPEPGDAKFATDHDAVTPLGSPFTVKVTADLNGPPTLDTNVVTAVEPALRAKLVAFEARESTGAGATVKERGVMAVNPEPAAVGVIV